MDKIHNVTIESNSSNKLLNLFEIYRSISIKYILVAENSLYKLLEEKSMLDKIKDDTSFYIISDFLNGIFKFNNDFAIDKTTLELISKTNDKPKSVLRKVSLIIEAFYSVFDRSKIDLKKFRDIIIENFDEYAKNYYEDIINLIQKSYA